MALFRKKTENQKVKPEEKTTEIKPNETIVSIGHHDISWQVLEAPHYSEKASLLEKDNKYIFMIKGRANKNQIKQGVAKAYNVIVEKVNILKVKPKIKMFRGKKSKEPARFTKAIVKIKEGQKINLGAK